MLPKTSAYVKSYYGQTKWMYFLIEDDELLEKYNTIWDKVSADIKKYLIVSLSATNQNWILLSKKMKTIIHKSFQKSVIILRKK